MCCEEYAVLEERALHFLAPAGGVTFAQRGQHADRAEHAAHDVVDRGAGPQRTAFRPRHVGEAAHHLHHLVQRQPVFIGAGQEALVRYIDQARKSLAQGRLAEAKPFHHAWAKIFQQHVALPCQFNRGIQSLRRLQVEHHAFLVAVEAAEKADAKARQLARPVAAGRLDLDDFGAEVGQDHAAGRAHHHVGKFDDANAGERKRPFRGPGWIVLCVVIA
jgi:hypothetical protein